MTLHIRLRACLAVVEDSRILLVPHFDTDAGPVQWNVPGGGVAFGEYTQAAAVREFQEETGFDAECDRLLDVYENIIPARPWHSVTFAYIGRIVGGQMRQEPTRWGLRTPRWFDLDQLDSIAYHPPLIVEKALQSGTGPGD
jgi:8-oxo-dGTP diphosphatase